MPIYNPKTGENDHVDIDLVDKIIIDPFYVEDITNNNKGNRTLKIEFSFTGDKENEIIGLKGACNDLELESSFNIPLSCFEEMLFNALHKAKNQRLENEEQFQKVRDGIVESVIQDAKNRNIYLVKQNTEYTHNNGIGIVRDLKANQDVGTFESMTHEYSADKNLVSIEDIILSGRTFDDLNDTERFEFLFFSLDDHLIYSVTTKASSDIAVTEDDFAVDIKDHLISVSAFDNSHVLYDMIVNAQEKKSLINGLDKDHPLYVTNYEEFRKSRLDILEDSKQKQKQQEILSQFADIDLDFDFSL